MVGYIVRKLSFTSRIQTKNCFCYHHLCPSQQFFSHVGQVFLGLTSTKQGLMCLAQGYNAVSPIRLKLATKLKEDQTLLWTRVAGAHLQINILAFIMQSLIEKE